MKMIFAFIALVLAGCASLGGGAFREIYNNDFVGITPEAPPSQVVGTWSGNMHYFQVTYQIEADGRGLACLASSESNVMQLKYSNDFVIQSSGQKLKVDSVTAQKLSLSNTWVKGKLYQFYRDDDLKNASPYCAEKLAKM